MKLSLTHQKSVKYITLTLLFVSLYTFQQIAHAQLKPVSAVYFFNEYLLNPAMAGREATLNASMGFRKEGTLFKESPATQYLSADYGFNSKSGIGLILYNDKAGVLRQTSAAATYAYHLPLSENNRLHFGISATFSNNSLDTRMVNGDADDPDVMDVNRRKNYFDSDFGIAFTSKRLSVQTALPNMLTIFRNNRANEINYALFFSSVSYRFETSLMSIEPKSMFRSIKGYKNILDFGSNFTFQSETPNKLNLLALYHTTRHATVGMGISQDESFSFNASYTLGTSQMKSITNGDLEIGLTLKIK